MRPHRHVLAAFALTLFAAPALAGCREPRTVDQIVADLHDPGMEKRRQAAEDLRTDQGIPEEAIPHLLQVAQAEPDPETLGAILITLGRSGVPEARPLIDQRIATNDPRLRRLVGRALQYWLIANGQLEPNAKLPKGWPYGQAGFPPPLYGKD